MKPHLSRRDFLKFSALAGSVPFNH
ncbi:MAG TPA: hypothetical protein DEH25_18570, partial [Chloroflexi bacterium]|nr:hypothetical protein [Chloroflexota bacterium]